MLAEDTAGERLDLAEGHRAHAGALKAERETANATEQIEHAHHVPHGSRSAPMPVTTHRLTLTSFKIAARRSST